MATTTVTDAYIASVISAQDGGGDDLDLVGGFFRIGEGGWELDGASQVPRTPDPTLTDIDCLDNPGRYPQEGRYYFQKNLTADKVTPSGTDSIIVECFVSSTEANEDDFGNAPEFYELGIFDADGVMVAYSTFAQQLKDDRRALRHQITIQRVQG